MPIHTDFTFRIDDVASLVPVSANGFPNEGQLTRSQNPTCASASSFILKSDRSQITRGVQFVEVNIQGYGQQRLISSKLRY